MFIPFYLLSTLLLLSLPIWWISNLIWQKIVNVRTLDHCNFKGIREIFILVLSVCTNHFCLFRYSCTGILAKLWFFLYYWDFLLKSQVLILLNIFMWIFLIFFSYFKKSFLNRIYLLSGDSFVTLHISCYIMF